MTKRRASVYALGKCFWHTLHRPDGKKFEGFWKAGKKDGRGRYVSSDGEVLEGTWRNDALVNGQV